MQLRVRHPRNGAAVVEVVTSGLAVVVASVLVVGASVVVAAVVVLVSRLGIVVVLVVFVLFPRVGAVVIGKAGAWVVGAAVGTGQYSHVENGTHRQLPQSM